MTTLFLVRSSSTPTPYHVLIESNGEAVAVHCDCEAGARGQYCKHKAAIISNQATALFDAAQVQDLCRVNDAIKDSRLYDAVKQIAELESLLETTKSKIAGLKKAAARAMKEGK